MSLSTIYCTSKEQLELREFEYLHLIDLAGHESLNWPLSRTSLEIREKSFRRLVGRKCHKNGTRTLDRRSK